MVCQEKNTILEIILPKSAEPAKKIYRRGNTDELLAKELELEAPGYRVLTNIGEHGGQEVPHFHVHLFGGRPLGRMLAKA